MDMSALKIVSYLMWQCPIDFPIKMLYNNSAARRVYKSGISKYIPNIRDLQDIQYLRKKTKRRRGRPARPGPAPRRPARWYFVRILYVLDI